MKKFLLFLVALVVILAVVVGVVLFRVDSIAKAGVERGGTYALGVPTTVEGVSVSLWGGTFDMSGLQVANPQGFDAPFLMKNGAFNLAVDSGSFFSDEIVVPLIQLDGMDIHFIKKDGKNNISPVLEHLKQFEGGAEAQEQTGSGKKFIINKLVIKNVTAHVDVPVVGQKSVKVPDIVLEDLTPDNAQGLLMSEIMARIFPMITAAAMQSLGDILPADLAGVLKGDLAGVADHLGGNVAALIKEPGKLLEGAAGKATEAIDKATEGLGDKLKEGIGDDAGDKVKEGTDKLKQGIGNLMGGDDEEQQ